MGDGYTGMCACEYLLSFVDVYFLLYVCCTAIFLKKGFVLNKGVSFRGGSDGERSRSQYTSKGK